MSYKSKEFFVKSEMISRIHNFNAGPAALPFPVLQQVQEELLHFRNSGMSIMEHSHRGKVYEQVHFGAMELLRELLGIPQNYKILFLQGGASLQFAMVPMNLLPSDGLADYILTGLWSEKALKEAELVGHPVVAATSKDRNYAYIPKQESLKLNPTASYVHITSNNTVYGSQWSSFPAVGEVSLIADMSSDLLSRRIDVSRFGLIYAGAQKNLGPAGLTVVIVRNDLLEQCRRNIPTMLSYRTHAESESLYNTPPTFAVYILYLVLQWVRDQGGIAAIESINRKKAEALYAAIDASHGFYRGTVDRDSRSMMNATFRLGTEVLEKKFVQAAKKAGFVGLKGHRAVGGIRASMYNAVTLETVQTFVAFMDEFKTKNRD